MATYSAVNLSVSWGEISMSGFGEGDVIEASLTNDAFTMREGVDGSAHFEAKASRIGTVTIRLIGSSPVNDLINAAHQSDLIDGGQAKPFFIKDSSGTAFVSCETGRVTKSPDFIRGDGLGDTVWVFGCIGMVISQGGTTVV